MIISGNKVTSYEVVCSGQIEEVLKLYHDGPAHLGINDTIKAIGQKYVWPGMNEDIKKYVSIELIIPSLYFIKPLFHLCSITHMRKLGRIWL